MNWKEVYLAINTVTFFTFPSIIFVQHFFSGMRIFAHILVKFGIPELTLAMFHLYRISRKKVLKLLGIIKVLGSGYLDLNLGKKGKEEVEYFAYNSLVLARKLPFLHKSFNHKERQRIWKMKWENVPHFYSCN